MKRILRSLLVAAVPLGGALADAPKEKNAKVTLVYPARAAERPRQELKGVLVEYGPGGYSAAHMPFARRWRYCPGNARPCSATYHCCGRIAFALRLTCSTS